ncbi:hypothetical protein PanWU01x14_223000 [Parasponia andersonii]|uniref:Reverse transcriptase domain-containing protein n=1 Tax=Parasponia andersonii TaxID=3476 RepID=A0A2P5BNR4_PARAD|nr:hypothetical protein PanWU01x14_223000 [Parasponia andersonii]
MILHAEQENQLLGMNFSRSGPQVSHLLFANDFIIFTKACHEDCLSILNILEVYEAPSGQKINMEKSAITFSPNIDDASLVEIQECLGLQNGASHDSHLRLPLVVGRNRKKTFASIKERVWKRVQSWRRGLFSIRERDGLIKSVSQTIPIYVTSIFKLPISLCNDLRSVLRRF